VRILREVKPELLFLDVQMPQFDGFDVLREIGATFVPAVIFVTAYDEFAVAAFEAYALDYLVKPLEVARFSRTIERVREHLKLASAGDLSRRLMAVLVEREKERNKQRIIVPVLTGNLVLNSDDIDWIEADDYYAAIHVGDQRHLIRESLSSLELRLDPSHFARTHRSAIVNIDRVSELTNTRRDSMVILRTGVRVPVSRRRRARLARLLRHHTP